MGQESEPPPHAAQFQEVALDTLGAERVSQEAGWADPRYIPASRDGASVTGGARMLGDSSVTRELWHGPVTVKAALSEGMIGICLPSSRSGPCSAWGRPLEFDSIGMVSAELSMALGPGAELLSAVVPEADLRRIAGILGLALDCAPPGRSGIVAMPGEEANGIRAILTNACHAVETRRSAEELESQLLVKLSKALSTSSVIRVAPSQRLRIAKAARDYIDSHLEAPLRLEKVAHTVGADVRTIQRAFREVFGASPYRYLQASRLRLAQRQLSRGAPKETTVTRVAHACGFEHLGRFAVDYRSMFGETPSVTLARPHP